VIPVQVLGELFGLLVRQTSRSRDEARQALLGWSDTFAAVETSPHIMQAATDIAKDHEFGIWEAVVLATASHAGCRLLLSENVQDGFTWGGVTIINPFAMPRHAVLETLWNEASE
jgi:predicted nucleic acid-binding protein